MADTKSTSLETNLTYIIDNCVTKDPDLHPDQYYMEILDGTDQKINITDPTDFIKINLR